MLRTIVFGIFAILLSVSAARATVIHDTSDEPIFYGRCMVLYVVPLRSTKLRPGEVVRSGGLETSSALADVDRDASYEIKHVVPIVPREKARVHQSDGTFETYRIAIGKSGGDAIVGYVTRPIVNNWGGCF
jgi:hypothetical protein